jgi:hypothetical protein
MPDLDINHSRANKQRITARLKPVLEGKLLKYSAAATGLASALSAPLNANAEVIATLANQQMHGYNNIYQIDLNNDGIADASIMVYTFDYCCSSGAFDDGQSMRARGAQPGNEIAINEKKWALPGKRGQIFGSSDPFVESAGLAYHQADGDQSFSTHHTAGPWFKMYHRFLGVKFLISGETHYGWIRLNVPSPFGGTITGYAYETEANKPITAGFTNFGGSIAPIKPRTHIKSTPQIHKVVPLTLGELAIGSAR